ncbi:MAG: phosphonate C-P lyase system protein PhnH [Pseudomonadota bacterium]
MSMEAAASQADVYAGGFAEPGREASVAFRGVLDALARPGRIVEITGATPSGALPPASGAALLCLADPDAPVWYAPDLGGDSADWVLFHTGAPRAASRDVAAFALGRWEDLMPLADWPAGTADYPDRSTTLLICLPSLEGGPRLRLEGPGIEGAVEVAPALPPDAATVLSANRARFPLGVDLFLVAGNRLMGLPRSTRVTAV